jgi:hypothetical protein
MSDIALAIPDQGDDSHNPPCHQAEKPLPLRRRVTDVPDANVAWFMKDGYDACMSIELARAELTAQRDGYVIRWVHPWVCQILEPVDEGGIIGSAVIVILDGTPDTDPRAPEIERQLLREAGLRTNRRAEKPTSIERDERGSVRRRYASYNIAWEHVSVCQLFEPDGTTLIGQSDSWVLLDPVTNPRARGIAADLLLEAGV